MLNLIAQKLDRLGVTANMATLTGFLTSFVAAYFLSQGLWLEGMFWILLAGAFDLIDGRLARLRKAPDAHLNRFGALFDSALDRYSDALFYLSVAYFYLKLDRDFYGILALSACAGAFEISYIRARIEGLGGQCRVGFWERAERIAALVIGCLKR